MDMQSLWRQTSTLPAHAPLEGDREVEALVIGGGMAGLLCAYLLKEKGISPLVIEAGRIAGGVTQNTTAKITAQHNLIYDKLCKTLGREAARQYAGANQRAVERFAQIIAREGIACGFERKDAYVYSAKDRDKLEREAETAASLGLPAEFTGEVPLPGFYLGAVLFRNQAQFHPLALFGGNRFRPGYLRADQGAGFGGPECQNGPGRDPRAAYRRGHPFSLF